MIDEYGLEVGDYVVYPAHGVGQLVNIEVHEIAGTTVQFYVINFEKEKMTLRLPPQKARQAGLRMLSSRADIEQAYQILSTRVKPKRAMWGRRAQEYETKINSGSPIAIAEVLRELYGRNTDVDQSYSERQIYQTALERLIREIAIIEKVDEKSAINLVEKYLQAA